MYFSLFFRYNLSIVRFCLYYPQLPTSKYTCLINSSSTFSRKRSIAPCNPYFFIRNRLVLARTRYSAEPRIARSCGVGWNTVSHTVAPYFVRWLVWRTEFLRRGGNATWTRFNFAFNPGPRLSANILTLWLPRGSYMAHHDFSCNAMLVTGAFQLLIIVKIEWKLTVRVFWI